jgi:SAM-dependent methyltransferase
MKASELERETIKGYFKFYNELAEKYPESKLVYATEAGRIRRTRLAELLLKDPSAFTLDLGCNDGPFKPYISRYVGLDMASACLRKFKAMNLQAIGQRLPFRDGVFERIFASEIVEHVWDRDRMLGECRRVLKPGGEILLSVPYGRNPYMIRPNGVALILRRFGVEYIPYVHGRFVKEEVKFLLERNGFTVKHLEQLERLNIIAIGMKNSIYIESL